MKDKEVYQKTLELFNSCCALCGKPYPQLHHIRYGSCGEIENEAIRKTIPTIYQTKTRK